MNVNGDKLFEEFSYEVDFMINFFVKTAQVEKRVLH